MCVLLAFQELEVGGVVEGLLSVKEEEEHSADRYYRRGTLQREEMSEESRNLTA